MQRSDEHIAIAICERMFDDPRLDAADIDVAVASGVVTLRGSVSSPWARRLAEDLADSVGGVRDVRNELGVPSDTPARQTPRRAA